MAGIKRVLDALRRETPVLTSQAENYPILRSRAAGDTPVDPTGIPISALPGADTPTDNDVVAGVQSETTKKFRLGSLLTWIKSQLSPSDIGAQGEILVSGILKGNGVGGISAAQPGTDYGTYSKPSGGIPASDLANGVIPTVPSASTANPQMDGTASPGSTGNWSDGGHVHPTDTTRAAAALEINGHALTGDFDLTAADVGALASNGTAVLSNAIAARHAISGEAGWYKFLSIPYVNGGSRDLWIMINTGNSASERSGILAIHMQSSLYGTDIPYVNLDVAHMPKDWVRYENMAESGQRYLTLYIRKDSGAQGQMQFYVLYAVNHAGTVLGNLVWSSDGPSGNPPAAAVSATSNTFTDATRILYFPAQAVSAGSAQQLISITDADITENHVLAGITFADPAYITGGGSWASTAGSFTLTGTATAATTADILLVRKGN